MNVRGDGGILNECKRKQKYLSGLRTKRREHLLQNKRIVEDDGKDEFDEIDNYYDFLNECKNILKNEQESNQNKIKVTIKLRKLIGKKEYIPIQEMMDCNIFSTLLQLAISNKDEIVQYQIAWVFTNIAVPLDVPTCDLFIKLGTMKVLLACGLSATHIKVATQFLWASTNFIVDNENGKKEALDNGIILLITRVMSNACTDVVPYWALSTLLRGKEYINDDIIHTFIQYIAYGLSVTEESVVMYCLHCVYYISRRQDGLLRLLESSILIRCFYLSSSTNDLIRKSSFKFIQSISSLPDPDFLKLFDVTNILPYFIDLLAATPISWYHRIILFVFGNLALSNDKYIDLFIDSGVYYSVIQFVLNSNLPEESLLRKESLMFIFASSQQNYQPLLDHLVQHDFIITIFKKIQWTDWELVSNAISAAHIFINADIGSYNFIEQFKEIGFDRKLEELVHDCDNEDLTDRGSTLLLDYFNAEESYGDISL